MKTKLALLFTCAELMVSAQTNSVHNWTLKSGAVFAGDYFTSGELMVVIKSHGTNCLLKISELSTNDWLYFQDRKAAQRQRQLDAEAAQMRAAGWIEFTSDLIHNFPEKVRTIIPGDGTVIKRTGWMGAEYRGLNNLNRNLDESLCFGVIDSQRNDFNYCVVAKKLYPKETFTSAEILAGALNNYTPNPLVNVAFNLKRGDKVRLIGYCDDSLPYAESPHGERDIHPWFYVERIEMIESAADAAAVQKVKNPDGQDFAFPPGVSHK